MSEEELQGVLSDQTKTLHGSYLLTLFSVVQNHVSPAYEKKLQITSCKILLMQEDQV